MAVPALRAGASDPHPAWVAPSVHASSAPACSDGRAPGGAPPRARLTRAPAGRAGRWPGTRPRGRLLLGQPCMGRLMSSDFGRDSSRPDHCHRSGPCRTSFSFHPCEPCEHRNVRWRHGRPVGLVAPTNHPCCRYTPNAVRRLEHSCSAKAEHRRSEGSLPSGADHRATTLYSAGPEGA